MKRFEKWLDDEIKQAENDKQYAFGDEKYEMAVGARLSALQDCKRNFKHFFSQIRFEIAENAECVAIDDPGFITLVNLENIFNKVGDKK